jgi:4-amino-4-deoxy-L-arabinose transferase-like glycosyltransferase
VTGVVIKTMSPNRLMVAQNEIINSPTLPVMPRRTQFLLLTLIIAGGLFLRLIGFHWGQGYEFNAIGDEIEAYQVGQQFLAGDQQALYLGQPNFKHGKVPGPLWAMVWAAGVRLGGGPEAVILTVVALNIVVIWLVFVLGKKLFDATHGLWAALLLATAPWPVYFSVGCTNPEVMAFFGALLYLALWSVVRRPKSPHIFGVLVVLAIMPQFHMFGVFFLPPVLLLLLLRRSELNWKWLVAGLVVAVLLYVPYVWGEAHNHWANTRRLLGEGDKFSLGSFKALSTTVMSLTNLFESVIGRRLVDYKIFGDAICGSVYVLVIFNVLSIGLSLLALGSFVMLFIKSIEGKLRSLKQALVETPAIVFTGIMVLLPLVLFIPTGASFNSRYVIALYPVLFILPAVLLVRTRYPRLIRSSIVITIVFNIWFCLAFFRHQEQRIVQADYFVPSFRKLELVYQKIQAAVGANEQPHLRAVGFPADHDALLTHGADALVKYVNLRAQFDHPGAPRQLRVEPIVGRGDNSQPGPYQGNGIAVVVLP